MGSWHAWQRRSVEVVAGTGPLVFPSRSRIVRQFRTQLFQSTTGSPPFFFHPTAW